MKIKSLALMLVLFCSSVYGQPPIQVPPIKNPAFYEKELKSFVEWSKKHASEDFYSGFKLKHKETGEIKKVSELKKFDKDIFFLFMTAELSKKLETTYNDWSKEIEDLKVKKEKKELDKVPTSLDQVQGFVKKLVNIREKVAVQWETLAERIFKEHADKFGADEGKHYMAELKKYNNTNKLIKR